MVCKITTRTPKSGPVGGPTPFLTISTTDYEPPRVVPAARVNRIRRDNRDGRLWCLPRQRTG